MRKIIFTLAFLILAGALFFAGTKVVKAGGCTGTCAAWKCDTNIYGGQTCSCHDILIMGGDQSQCQNKNCPSGYYVCNTGGGCCPTGSGGGGNTYNGGDPYCAPNGLVQVCGSPPQTTCKRSNGGCWGSGGKVVGGDCNEHWGGAECQTNCWCEAPCNANAWGGCSTSCGPGIQYNACGTSRSCQINDPNVWGAWSACSASCGGGTQTRINQCGTSYQTQACNTQACYFSWWQVKDSDVATNGDLVSKVPVGHYFGLAGDGGYPGVPAYSASTNLTGANISQAGWLAQSPSSSLRTFDYKYFADQIPKDTVIYNLSSNTLDQTAINANTKPSYGYYWYKFDGSTSNLDLNLNSNLNIGAKKVILLINSADFYIKGNINLTKGSGFFMAITGRDANGGKGNIAVDPSVGGGAGPNLEGIYEADGQFKTGVAALELKVRGSVAAYGGAVLKRDLGDAANAVTPSEQFEFAPDQIMLFPTKLGYRKMNWKEVAP